MSTVQSPLNYYRYCPGEEEIHISDAICRGRRRSHFPKCPGCQFNDDEKSAGAGLTADRLRVVSAVERVFRAADVLGMVPDPLTYDVAWRVGHATAQYLNSKLRAFDRTDPRARSIVVGRDMRPHSAPLQNALIEGIRGAGLNVINIGAVDSPQLYFAVNHLRACGGIQTTGGRHPADYNGFRICSAKALPIDAETGLASIRDLAMRVPKHQTASAARLTDVDLTRPYGDFLRGFLQRPAGHARQLRVVADASNGVAGRWLPVVFQGVAEVAISPMNFEWDGGFAHDPDPLLAANNLELRNNVRELKADLGVCFDGDARRCVFVDHRGAVVPADVMIALLARRFLEREECETIVFDLRASRVLFEEIERAGGDACPERVGAARIRKAMLEHKAVFGGDLAGRYYFRDHFYTESAFLAVIHALNMLIETGRPLAELARPLLRYRSTGEVPLRCNDPTRAAAAIAAAHPGACRERLDGLYIEYTDWWCTARPIVDPPQLGLTVEARTKRLADQKLAELQRLLSAPTEQHAAP